MVPPFLLAVMSIEDGLVVEPYNHLKTRHLGTKLLQAILRVVDYAMLDLASLRKEDLLAVVYHIVPLVTISILALLWGGPPIAKCV